MVEGIGEGGAIAPGACLANAVSDALAPLGVTVNATPLTPEAVLRLIQGAAR
ncbi:MAG: hypothetical protein H0V00_00295 [Chloroflexia bacterium]|nr:hypothetical protein [Chloroflexia bacterium]